MFTRLQAKFSALAAPVALSMLCCPLALAELSTSANSSTRAEQRISNEETLLFEIEKAVARHQVTDTHFEQLGSFLARHEHHALALFLLGRCYEQRGLVDMARDQFDKADRSRNDPSMILRLFRRHVANDELQLAFSLLPFVSREFPDDPAIKLVDAIFQEESGMPYLAISSYRQLLQSPAPPLGCASRLAAISLGSARYSEALSLARRDLSIDPGFVPGIIAKATALLKMNQAEQAMNCVKPAVQSHPFSRRLTLLGYQCAVACADNIAALRFALKNLAVSDSSSYLEDAKRRVFETLSKIPDSESSGVVDQTSREIDRTEYAMKYHFFLGEIYTRLKRPEHSIQEFLTALRLDPDYEPPVSRLGRLIEVYERNYEVAERFYNRVGQTKPLYQENNIVRFRLKDRMSNRKRDIAWRMQDWLFHLRYGSGKYSVSSRALQVIAPGREQRQPG